LGEVPEGGDVTESVVLFFDRMKRVTGQFLSVDGGQRKTL